MQPPNPPRKRPELLLGAAALLAAAGVLLFLAARNNTQTEPAPPFTTIHMQNIENPFEQQHAPPPGEEEPLPPGSFVVGYTEVAIYQSLPTEATANPPAQMTQPAAPGLVNINTATQAQLETLPGIGPVRAQAILEWRARNGRFTDPAQLLEISGIGEATLMNMLPFITN